MKLLFNEPSNPRYVYINPNNNIIHLFVPLTSGVEIGLDNTCRSTLALKQFFNKMFIHSKDSAVEQLNIYKELLEKDIHILACFGKLYEELLTKKQGRLTQINHYIRSLSIVENNYTIGILNDRKNFTYPEPINQLLSSPFSNLYGMRLRPNCIDEQLNIKNPLFTMDRTASADTLRHALYDAFKQFRKTPQLTQKEKLIEWALSDYLSKSNAVGQSIRELLPALLKILSSTYGHLFSPKQFEFTLNQAELTLLSYNEEEVITQDSLNELLTDIVNANDPTNIIFPITSPFNSIKTFENFSLITQFLLAEINFYAHSHNKTTADFGRVFDKNIVLAKELAHIVIVALNEKQSVEKTVCQFINDHNLIDGSLSEQDTHFIKQRFAEHYAIVRDSSHFDEFMVLDSSKKGSFFTHQGSISFDFSMLTALPVFSNAKLNDNDIILKDAMTLPTVLPSKNDKEIDFIDIDQEQMGSLITCAIEAGDQAALNTLLLFTLDDGKKVFECLTDIFFKPLIKNKNTLNLLKNVKNLIKDEGILHQYNVIVFNEITAPLTRFDGGVLNHGSDFKTEEISHELENVIDRTHAEFASKDSTIDDLPLLNEDLASLVMPISVNNSAPHKEDVIAGQKQPSCSGLHSENSGFVEEEVFVNERVNDMLDVLMNNVKEKKENRVGWFTYGTENKIKKLEVIQRWLKKNPLSAENAGNVLALIRDTCAIKRNNFGFYQPHSLMEFNKLKIESGLQASVHHFSSKDLEQLHDEEDLNRLFIKNRLGCN